MLRRVRWTAQKTKPRSRRSAECIAALRSQEYAWYVGHPADAGLIRSYFFAYKTLRWQLYNGAIMIIDTFNERIRANMEVALERACQPLGRGGTMHPCRQFVALHLISAAREGATTLAELTEVARAATRKLRSRKRPRRDGDGAAAPQI
jgi:hypothetical protein